MGIFVVKSAGRGHMEDRDIGGRIMLKVGLM
jgi:hypothetical protein